jgi:HKD family nuclease
MATVVSFITNTGENHKDFLLNLFERADKVIFAVGFLKQSGFRNIKEHLKDFCKGADTSSAFYIGTGLGETDPDALQSLNNLIKKSSRHELILVSPDAGIFHPKIYLFISGEKVTIVTGSSNLTQHGWRVNDEVSMVAETTINSLEYQQLSVYFEQLHSRYYTDNITNLIQRYQKEREEYLRDYGKPQAFRFRRRITVGGIDIPRLRRYYDLYTTDENWFVIPERREEQYRNAKKNLDQLASDIELSETQFHRLFGPLVGHKDFKPKLWHSGSIHRGTYNTLEYPKGFRDIIRMAKQNLAQPAGAAYENVVTHLNELRKAKEIVGVGENIVTEILMSYRPDKFANLNKNPLTVLSLIGREFPYIGGFRSDSYEDYVTLLSKIRDELGMSTFLEIDSFFNYVYWNLMEE